MSAPRTLLLIVPEMSSAELSYTNQEVGNGFNEIQVNLTSTPLRSINCEQLDFSRLGSSIDLTTGMVYSSDNISRYNKSSQILGLQEPDVMEQIKGLKIIYTNIDTCLNTRE